MDLSTSLRDLVSEYAGGGDLLGDLLGGAAPPVEGMRVDARVLHMNSQAQ